MSETKPWSKNSLHLIFENIFNQMRKPQNNEDQRGFHLFAAHKDVQPSLLMAVLEENKTTSCVTETITHTYTCSSGIVKKCAFTRTSNYIHSFFYPCSSPGVQFSYIISSAGSSVGSTGAQRQIFVSSDSPWSPFSHLSKLWWSILWITSGFSIKSE